MMDLSWLSREAMQVHNLFTSLFYALVTVFLCLGVFIEYFKWPLGGTPSFSVLVGRALIAAIMLHTYPQVSNLLADIADTVSRQIGDMNEFKVVLSKMGDHLGTLTWSWVSVRETVIMVISFVCFFLLYFSVHVVQAFLLYAWTILYVFSPVLIALFVLPATASATKALYRTLIEMSCWKIVWTVLATLLWSTALSDINKPQYEISFITAICFNLILAGSLLLTPVVVHSLAESGLSGMAKTVGAIAVGAATFSPGKVASSIGEGLKKGKSAASNFSEHVKNKYFGSPGQTSSSPARAAHSEKRAPNPGQSSRKTPKDQSKKAAYKRVLPPRPPQKEPKGSTFGFPSRKPLPALPQHHNEPPHHSDQDAPAEGTSFSEI